MTSALPAAIAQVFASLALSISITTTLFACFEPHIEGLCFIYRQYSIHAFEFTTRNPRRDIWLSLLRDSLRLPMEPGPPYART
jgi:hypothetical protein